MMFQRQPLTVAILAASLGLVACNSNDHDTPISTTTPTATTTVTVTPSLGKILSGRVVLRDAKTGVDLAPPKTLTPADNGVATFTVPVAKLAAPIIAAVLPTTAGKLEYADEALEKATTITVPVADASKPLLRAAASVTPNANIGVTALTESAVQQAEKADGGLIAQNINQANAAVKNQLKLNFDVTQAPIVIGVGEFDKLVNTALDAQRRAYASYLATLAKEAQRMKSASLAPAYDMAKVLASDFSDGTFDAKQGTTALSFYNATFVNAWINWVQNFYASFAQLTNIVALNRWYGGFNIADTNSVTSFPDATPIRTVNGIEEYACSGEGRIKSSSGASIYMDFVNQRGSNMNVYWLNYNTGRVSYKSNLATGQTHNQQTFVTHPWLITDNTGACVGIYRPVTQTDKTLTFNANGSVTLENKGGNEQISGTVATGLAGTYNLVYQQIVAGNPYSNNQQVSAIIAANTLTIAGKALSNPYLKTGVPAEIYWQDGTLEYALSNNSTGAFNEINVSNNGVFLGQFTKAGTVTNTCSSQGQDEKLGFANAPDTFCGFAKFASTAISSPDIYTFTNNSSKHDNVKITVVSDIVTQVAIENDDFAFACGGSLPGCTGVTFQSNGSLKQFIFNNTFLSAVSGTTHALKVSNGSLSHQVATTANTDTCASLGVNSSSLSAISDFVGAYDVMVGNVAASFQVAANGDITLKGQASAFKQVCINPVQSNGQGFQLITNKGTVLLFKGTDNSMLAEGRDYTNTTGTNYFSGNKQMVIVPLAATGTASGKITNVQYNKDGTTTGGKGELRANGYEFSGDLNTAYTLKINDTIQNLRYELANRNGQFTAVSLYSLTNSASPLFVYLCDTTGENTCLNKVSFTQGATPTLVFTDMKLRGVFQPQFDAIINGQIKLNP
ncbi:MAG: hypothetical protein Q7U16_04370 [Agitococcus sp.]|nr:hypothetical protein [Agitococcus sp.]